MAPWKRQSNRRSGVKKENNIEVTQQSQVTNPPRQQQKLQGRQVPSRYMEGLSKSVENAQQQAKKDLSKGAHEQKGSELGEVVHDVEALEKGTIAKAGMDVMTPRGLKNPGKLSLAQFNAVSSTFLLHCFVSVVCELDKCHIKKRILYELVGSVTHHGSKSSTGHYTADIKYLDGPWMRCDDEKVAPVSSSDVFHDQAYILLYERICCCDCAFQGQI
ncbi:uncharacterized protein LOC120253678 [Dioscorea cayenensis subsp. rotundata]|uniref:ubiquitinyl hydrolase 1 n=1 Tax=Dioscorea cayennensis subsp. rotundata TaxID=55577 RepID=A0AB40ASE5_DIOCR|nr:uncharacterized protein LOC120253678 [Dioscorea cayenensis subsp. rotundata]